METSFHMSRRIFLRRSLLSLGGAVLTFGRTETTRSANDANEHPNILLVVSDDQGWGDLPSNWKKTDICMSVMEKIGRAGIRFTNFYVNPLCAPTRSSLLTGLYSMENGMWRGPSRTATNHYRGIRKDIVTLPQVLQRAGYATGIFGKWHLGYDKGNLPNDRGFDEFYGFLGGAHTYELAADDRAYFHNERPYCENGHATDYITDKAAAFIHQNASGKKPFFCYVAYNAVHGPLWREERRRTSAKPEWLGKAGQRGIGFPRRDYVGVLEHMDHSVGRLLDLLDRLKIEKNTLVIYLSDNGAITIENPTKSVYPGNNGPLRGGKGTVYEGGIRVPCVMQWKGRFPEGMVSTGTAIHADVFATCLDAAGLPVPQKNGKCLVRGVSLLPHIFSGGTKALPVRTVIFELTGNVALRKGKYKLVGKVSSSRADWKQTVAELRQADLELYDLSDDIGETKNLRTTRSNIYQKLKGELLEYFEGIANQFDT